MSFGRRRTRDSRPALVVKGGLREGRGRLQEGGQEKRPHSQTPTGTKCISAGKGRTRTNLPGPRWLGFQEYNLGTTGWWASRKRRLSRSERTRLYELKDLSTRSPPPARLCVQEPLSQVVASFSSPLPTFPQGSLPHGLQEAPRDRAQTRETQPSQSQAGHRGSEMVDLARPQPVLSETPEVTVKTFCRYDLTWKLSE